VTYYFGKHDRTVGVVILPKIPKIGFHNSNGYSLGVALSPCSIMLTWAATQWLYPLGALVRPSCAVYINFFENS
jgi:hypothetical protein